MELADDQQSQKDLYFDKIEESIETQRGRINNILNVEMINSNDLKMKMESIHPGKLVEKIHTNFKMEAENKGIKINNNCNGFSKKMKVDYNYTLQVMENLVSNAIKFSKAGEDINLNISETEEHVNLHVKDSGPGFTVDDQSKLFKKFSTLSARPTGKEESTRFRIGDC